MPELVVETVDIHNVLESSGLEEYVVLAECERIAAEPIIIIVEQKVSCAGHILNGEAAGTEDFQLFFNCLKILICHIIAPYKQNALKCACVSTEA